MKCAACGSPVEFPDKNLLQETVCPGCAVRVRRRTGDETMAMPVSMMLPDQFQQADLQRLVKRGEVLQDRYRKVNPDKQEEGDSDKALANALESLASSISQLERKLSDEPGAVSLVDEDEMIPILDASRNGNQLQAPGDSPNGKDEPRPAKSSSPLQASVLVRREAAAVTHRMLREKNRDRIWSESGSGDDGRIGLFAYLMKKAPATTIVVTLLGMFGLIAGTIVLMKDSFRDKPEPLGEEALLPSSNIGQLWEDDPEAAQAEAVARGFLNAVSAEAAKPFVYQSARIAPRLEKLFQPITSPGMYRLALKSRALTPGGQSIFAFRVWPEGEDSRMLVVVPEGKMPKVQWEFFAEVGELSWDEFMTIRPDEGVLMRTWVRKSNLYFPPYTQQDWQAYLLHDYTEEFQMIAYADRGSGADWKLSKALEEAPVKFNRYDAVMAQAEVSYIMEMPSVGEDKRVIISEITRVPATSWLPRGYLPSNQ
ncbi:MAG: hypothetical protein HKN82_17600 [Akkermansiaceae bacterium]|nr:hypothetical protein [Akkermansiaceae bacterium]NNM29731.1 hypothetical protein [Akkermansiaceae bacterium]